LNSPYFELFFSQKIDTLRTQSSSYKQGTKSEDFFFYGLNFKAHDFIGTKNIFLTLKIIEVIK
jgi:hypothetical protein